MNKYNVVSLRLGSECRGKELEVDKFMDSSYFFEIVSTNHGETDSIISLTNEDAVELAKAILKQERVSYVVGEDEELLSGQV